MTVRLQAYWFANDPHRAEYNNMVDKPVSPEIQSAYWDGIDTANPFLQNSNFVLWTYLHLSDVLFRPVTEGRKDKHRIQFAENAGNCDRHYHGTFPQERDNPHRHHDLFRDSVWICTDGYAQVCSWKLRPMWAVYRWNSIHRSWKAATKQIEGMSLLPLDNRLTISHGQTRTGRRRAERFGGRQSTHHLLEHSCSHCIEQMPEIEKYLEKRGNDKFTTVAVCINGGRKRIQWDDQPYPAMLRAWHRRLKRETRWIVLHIRHAHILSVRQE